MRRFKLAIAAALLPLTACTGLGEGSSFGAYSLVRVKPTKVGNGSVIVDPPRPWNKQRRFFFFDSVRWVEDWTLNGPYLDGITFVSGLPGGEYLVRQRKSDERQVPKFRSNMTLFEIAAMLESFYRVRGGAVEFTTLSLAPASGTTSNRAPQQPPSSFRHSACRGVGASRYRSRRCDFTSAAREASESDG